MGALKLFFDSFSQPSRAVLLLLHANRVPYEASLIKIAQAEHRTNEDFVRVNPAKKVPAMDDNGFWLFESSAIMQYLVKQYKLPDHWYPVDTKQRAKIDEYLSWHHTNLRIGAGHTIFHKILYPSMTGKEPDKKRVEESKTMLAKSLSLIESYFLKGNKFISSEEISIADLQALCELTQFCITGVDPWEGKPRITQWMADCKKELEPHYEDVHKMIHVARDRGIFKGKL